MITPTDSCAFLPCDQVDKCALVGGCVQKRFGKSTSHKDVLKKGAPALVGTKPARTVKPQALKAHRKGPHR